MSSGTSGSMRKLRALLTTMWPASAKARSMSPATEASRPEKTTFGPRPGTHASTIRSADASGIGVDSFHGATDLYALPSERSLAASHVHRNHGCPASRETNCCPTTPVAPNTPTSIASIHSSLPVARLPINKKPAHGLHPRRVAVDPVIVSEA